jgi:hypothetical protein
VCRAIILECKHGAVALPAVLASTARSPGVRHPFGVYGRYLTIRKDEGTFVPMYTNAQSMELPRDSPKSCRSAYPGLVHLMFMERS